MSCGARPRRPRAIGPCDHGKQRGLVGVELDVVALAAEEAQPLLEVAPRAVERPAIDAELIAEPTERDARLFVDRGEHAFDGPRSWYR